MGVNQFQLDKDVYAFLCPLVRHIRRTPWEDAQRLAQNLYVIARDYMRVPESWDVMAELSLIAGGMKPLGK